MVDPRELAETFEARRFLDMFSAQRAAQLIREHQMAHLEAVCDERLAAVGKQAEEAESEQQRSQMLDRELNFHLSIAHVAGNNTVAGLTYGDFTVNHVGSGDVQGHYQAT